METSRRALLVLLISSFVILPIIMPFVINLMQKYDDKIRQATEKPGKEYGVGNLTFRTLVYAVAIGFLHGMYFFPQPKAYLFSGAISLGVLILLISPTFLFATAGTISFFFHCANVFFNLDPASTPVIQITPSVIMIFVTPILFAHNKVYNTFYKWKSVFSISPNQTKGIIYHLRDHDSRVATDYFYTEEQNGQSNHSTEAKLWYKMEPHIKNKNAQLFFGVSPEDPVTLSDRIRSFVNDIDRRFIKGTRNFYYFFIVFGIIYLLHFIVTKFTRVF